MMKLIYRPDYDLRYHGLEKLHPFDGRKYSRAYALLQESLGAERIAAMTLAPGAAVSDETLQRLHSAAYLDSLHSSQQLALILEMAYLAFIPFRVLRQHLLHPMRLATAGTLLAARVALEEGIGWNLSGGYHHASPEHGEGFCVYADIALAWQVLHDEGLAGRALYIDVDAHQGNGNERAFMHRDDVLVLDIYNADIFPHDLEARRRIDIDLALHSETEDDLYLYRLAEGLAQIPTEDYSIAFVVAGTDPYEEDLLGRLSLSAAAILQRDQMVLDWLRERAIPTVVTSGGGYSLESFRLIAKSIAAAISHEEA